MKSAPNGIPSVHAGGRKRRGSAIERVMARALVGAAFVGCAPVAHAMSLPSTLLPVAGVPLTADRPVAGAVHHEARSVSRVSVGKGSSDELVKLAYAVRPRAADVKETQSDIGSFQADNPAGPFAVVAEGSETALSFDEAFAGYAAGGSFGTGNKSVGILEAGRATLDAAGRQPDGEPSNSATLLPSDVTTASSDAVSLQDAPDAEQMQTQELPAVEDGSGSAVPRAEASPAAPAQTYGPVLPTASARVPAFDWAAAPEGTPPALAEAIRIVTRHDPLAQSAWAGARAALQQVKGAEWARFPALTTDLNLSNSTNHIAPSVAVELPLWTGGRIGSVIDRAKQLEGAAVSRWRETLLDLALQVNEAYYNIVLYTQLSDMYAESLEEHQRLVETMQRRVNQEVSPLADLELARSRAAQIEQELSNINAQRRSAMQNLAELVRDPSYDFGKLPWYDPIRLRPSWTNIAVEAVQFSPTRERLQYEANAAQSEIKVARSSLYPQLNAVYSYSDFVGSRVGLGVRLQTSNGLSQFSAISAASARYDQAVNQVQLSVRQLRQSVAGDVIALEASMARAAVSSRASQTAARVSESYMRQFIAGRRSWLDVMNSLREYLSSRSSLAQAQVSAMALETKLNLRSGRWGLERTALEN